MAEARLKGSKVYAAIEDGNRALVKSLLKGGADPNVLDDKNFSPLLQAVRHKHFAIALELLTHGALPDFGGGVYGSPLHVATVNVDPAIFGADPNFCDGDGHTPLHVLFSVFDSGGDRSIAISLFLLMKGAKCNIIGKSGWAPLHLGTKRNQEQALQFVADCCKIRRAYESGGFIPPCSLAAMSNFDLNVAGGPQKWTPLHLAAREGLTSSLKSLIGAGANPTAVNAAGFSPRDVCGGMFECHKLLQRAEKEWLWWKIYNGDKLVSSKLPSTTWDDAANTLELLAAKSGDHLRDRSLSLEPSINSVVSRRSIRKLKTHKFATAFFESDEEDISPMSTQDSNFDLPEGLSMIERKKTWSKDELIRELTEFMEPDVPFDIEAVQNTKLQEFAERMSGMHRSTFKDHRNCWSSIVLDKSKRMDFGGLTVRSRELMSDSSNDSLDKKQHHNWKKRDLIDRDFTCLVAPLRELSNSHAPLTARTHKRVVDNSIDRAVPVPTVLSEQPSTMGRIYHKDLFEELGDCAFDIHTPLYKRSPTKARFDYASSLRLNAFVSTGTSTSSESENQEDDESNKLLEYYQCLNQVTHEDTENPRITESLVFYDEIDEFMKLNAFNREKSVSYLANLLQPVPDRGKWTSDLYNQSISLMVGDLRETGLLETLTIEDDVVSSAPHLYKMAARFASQNDEFALRQLFNRITIDELVSVRSMTHNGSKLVASCIQNPNVRERTILCLLSYVPYDSRSNAYELHSAVRRHMFHVVRLLLVQGADPNAVDCTGRSALHTAVLNRCRQILLSLVYHPRTEINLESAIGPTRAGGPTALEIAIYKGDVFAIGVLINRGAVLKLGSICRGKWSNVRRSSSISRPDLSTFSQPGSILMKDVLRSIIDPTKRSFIGSTFEHNNFGILFNGDMVKDVTSYISKHMRDQNNKEWDIELDTANEVWDDSTYDISMLLGQSIGPPSVMKSTTKSENGNEAVRFALRRYPLTVSALDGSSLCKMPQDFTTRCSIPSRTCQFCSYSPAQGSRRSIVNATGPLITMSECANCSMPMCSNCTVTTERISHAAMPLLHDLSRASSSRSELITYVGVRGNKSITPGTPRTKSCSGVSVLAITKRLKDPESPLEKALKLAPKAIFDVLSLAGGSLEAVWCSDSLMVSNGVCGMIAKSDITFDDHCAIVTGVHGVYTRIHKWMNKKTPNLALPRKSVGLCTPRIMEVRGDSVGSRPLIRQSACDYGPNALAHIISEEKWLNKSQMWQHLVSTAEILSLCPYCATFLTSIPCLLRRS